MWMLIACTAGPAKESETGGEIPVQIENVEVTLTPTKSAAVELRWTTSEPTRGWVEYGETEELGRKSPMETEARTDHSLLLVGIPYGQSWQLRAAWEGEDGVLASETLSYQPPPREMTGTPTLENGSADEAGFFLVPQRDGALITDRGGQVVWEHSDSFTTLEHSQIRVVDGVVYRMIFDRTDSGLDRLIGVDLGGNLVEELVLPGAHHDFVFRNGDLYYLGRDTREGPDGKQWVGDNLIRRSPDGTETPIWSTWDIALNTAPQDDGFYEAGLDVAHVNGLSWNEERQLFLISSKIQKCVWAIDDQGNALWSVGDSPGAMKLTDGNWVGTPHGPLLVGNLLYLFDNDPIEGRSSRGVAYSLDFDASNYAEAWSYSDGRTRNNVLGNTEPSSDGKTFVFYGRAGGITEVDADGTALWTLSTPPSGYMHAVDDLGGPLPE